MRSGEKPAFDHVRYRVVGTEAARVAALQAKEIDVTVNLDIADLDQFSSDDQWTAVSEPSSWTNHILLNQNANPALADVRVRQALNYGLDKEAITSTVLGDSVDPSQGQVLTGPFDPVNGELSAYPYDPDRARALLSEAGYGGGLTLELAAPLGTYVSSDQTTVALVDQWKKIGVTVDLNQTPFADWVSRTHTPEAADLTYRGALGYYTDDLQVVRYYLPTGSTQIHIPKSQADDDYAAAVRATDASERERLIDRITQKNYDQADFVFLWPQPAVYVVDSNLEWNNRPNLLLWPQDFTTR